MIYLKEGNIPLNLCTDDDISQQENNTYQLTFKYPVSDEKWSLLQNEVHLLADDLSGEQEFVIIDIQKGHGYITVYANQVATLLNGYSIRKINVDRANGFTVMNKLVEGLKRECPFTFFSDISELHTLNIENVSVIDALLKGQHSIIGQWGGDLVRDKYSMRLLKNGGIENQSLFMYKKNLSEYKESTTTKSLKTRIHFRKVITASGEGEKDQVLEVTVDSPLIDKYKHIYEDDMEVQDQDVKTIEDLKEYGKKYFQSSLCDLPDESLEIDVVGHADQPVKIFDTAAIFYELYNVDIRKKITSYNYSPMSKKLKKIGFGKISRSLGGAIGKIVDDVVKEKIASYDAEYEAKVQKLVDNANAEYEKRAKEIENKVTDGLEEAKAKAEVVKGEISAEVTEKIAVANQANKNEIVEEFKAQYNGIEVKMEGLQATTDKLKNSDADIQKLINDFKAQTQSKFAGVQGAQSRFEQTTEKAISDLTNVTNGKADRSYVEQTVAGVKEMYEDLTDLNTTNLMLGTNEPFAMGYSIPATAWIEDKKHTYLELGPVDQRKYPVEILPQKGKFYNFIPKNGVDYTQSIIVETDAEFKPEGKFQFSWYTNKGHKFDKGSIKKIGENLYRIWATTTWDKSDTTLRAFDIFHINNVLAIQSTGTYIAFSKPKLTTGKMPSDWSPAPEDQEQSISQVKSSFERTAQGLSTQLSKLEAKTAQNGELEQRMLTYSEKATAEALKSTRQILEQGYVAKSQYTEDVAGINRKFETISTSTDSKISSKLAEFKQGIDGQISTIISQFDGVLKKTDINITDGQISFGTGKTINGRTISSLLVQEPEAIALIAKLIKVKGDMVVDGSITSRHLASHCVRTGHMESGSVTTQILASNAVTAEKLLVDSAMINKLVSNQAFVRELISQRAFITELNSIKIAAERIQGGRVTANSGKSIFDLDSGRLSFYDNFTGVFRDQANASSQGLFFRNDDVTINGRRYINSKAIIGADRRDNDIRSHWNQGGFNGMIVDTIKGVGTGDHDNADKVTFVGDRFHFTHSYDYDPNTNTNPYGWKITTWGQTTISPFGTNGRNTNVQAGDFLLINNGNNGVWLRQALRTLKTALQHFVNAGFATDDFTPQNGRSMRIALHSSIRNAVASSLREFDKFGI
ncbi:phage tail spike protein [Streptococcus parasanguinis]|uniref:phage tail spike protein n=1 Tax=Streptococcus parasanguinis TaxID=1318 RepID=UPI001898965C|nr:phage tail spike protein [Streptococcus parasanguinis]